MKLPQVHPAVGISGLVTALGSALAFAVANPSCAAGFFPAKDALVVTTVLGVIAAFLPQKDATKAS